MAINRYTAGSIICSEGEPLKELYVIGNGTIAASFPGGDLSLQKGDIIGIQDIKTGIHSCTYTAQSDAALVPYPFNSFEGLISLFTQKPDVMHLFFTAATRFSSTLLKYCNDYVASQAQAAEDEASSEDADALSLIEVDDSSEEDIDIAQEVIPVDESDLPDDLKDALAKILEFSGVPAEISERFTDAIDSYKALSDKESSEDKVRKLRMSITKDYYVIYKKSIEKILIEEVPAPPVVKLFLNFGLVDVHLAGISNAVYLLGLIDNYHGDAARGVYTYPEWLTAIYTGKKEPCRNEFDLDYPAWLREQRSQGNISEAQVKELTNSQIDKVRFEIDNVLPIVNKMTYGRISTFIPILSEHALLKSLPDIIVTPHRIEKTIKSIKQYDFSAYYRETSYINEKAGVAREQIDVEVLPDVILAPNAGVRGAMWQEIEGKRRTTPARMMLSILALEDITKLMVRMTGEFRWEMCKRIQGAHWNNIAEKSLTSEFCDYAQFYKRNHDLSPEAKEKIKLQLTKAKNSMKELFIQDYTSWITYEGNGAPRLNKISRAILFTYCPFPQDVRTKLAQHPLYGHLIDRYNLKMNQKLHHFEMVQNKLEKANINLPVELMNQMAFLKL